MKKLLVMMMLLPSLLQAQEEEPPNAYSPKNEIGIATGLNFQPTVNFDGMDNGDQRITLGYLHNFDKLQMGVRVEAGSDFFKYVYFAPVLLVNKKFTLKRSYLYAGTAAGYYQKNEGLHVQNRHMRGYTLGLQGGVSFFISKHFLFTSEIAVRSTQFWYKVNNYYPLPVNSRGVSEYYSVSSIVNDFYLSFPVMIGLRYRF